LAIYAADIQINIKNKGELRTLESRFKKIEIAAVSLSKTLKGLGRRNAIKVDTRAAMSAISALEARIRGLNRTVNLDARSSASGGGGGGMSGAAMPILATAFSGRLGGSGGSRTTRFRGSGLTRGDNERLGLESAARNARLDELQNSLNQNQKVFDDAKAVLDETKKSIDTLDKARKQKFDEYLGAAKKRDALKGTKVLFPKVRQQIKDQQKLVTELYKQEDALGDQLKTAKGLKEVQEGTLNSAEKQLKQSQKNLEIFKDQKQAAKVTKAVLTDPKQLQLQEALSQAIVKQQDVQMKLGQSKEKLIDLTAQEKKLAGDLNRLKGRGFDRENKSFRNTADQLSLVRRQITNTTKAIEGGTSKSGKTVVTGLNNDLIEAAKLIDKADKELQAFKATAAKPVKGGFLQQIQTGFQGLGAKGSMGAMGKGALGATALIPGFAPFALGAGIGQAGKTGGQAVAGGIMGAVGAGAVMGTVALVEFGKASANVAAEMDRMRIALTGVVPDQESYNTSLEKVSTLSKKYGISQRLLLKGFTQLQASADAAGFGVEDTGNLMEGLLARTLASGKGLEEFKGVMLAASQILSKGKLQAEEARGQIGERIPGFMADLAASMDISMKELDKAMEQGQVTLEDFFKLGEDLLKNNEQTALKLAESYANAGMRLNTAVENLQASFGKLSMVLGAKFQNQATDLLEFFTKVVDKINGIVIASIRAQLALDSLIDKTGLTNFSIEFKGGTKIGLTDRERRDLEQELAILTGKQTVRKKSKKDIKDENDLLAKQAVAWKQIEDRLKIDTQFQKDRISLGEKEAEIQRELAEMKLQFPDKDLDEIEKRIRALKDLEEQTVSNSVAFKELQESAAQRLKDLQNPINQLKTITEAFEDSFSSAIREVVRGTKSIGDAVASMLNRIADAFIQNAADMAAAAASNALMKFIGKSLFSGIDTGGATPTHTLTSSGGSSTTFYTGGSGTLDYAKGGYVDRPTNAIIGEGGEGEYIIPESKLASSLSRFQAGHRGNSVVPNGRDGGGASGGGSGEVTVNYTGPTLNFNGDEYVPRSAVPQIINSAAMAGATAGRANTMKDLKNSRSQRSRLGL
jgi:tape measure domain-containing protein